MEIFISIWLYLFLLNEFRRYAMMGKAKKKKGKGKKRK